MPLLAAQLLTKSLRMRLQGSEEAGICACVEWLRAHGAVATDATSGALYARPSYQCLAVCLT